MVVYLGRRLAQALLTIFAVLTITFFLGRASGEPGALLLPDNATADQVDALNDTLGFGVPLGQQYLDFLVGALRGDLGTSYREIGTPALDIVLERLPATFELAIVAFVIGLLLALVGAIAIQLTGSATLRSALIWGGSLRHSVPDFFFALLLVIVFSVMLGWLPSLGHGTLATLVLPVVTIATGQFVLYVRLLDSTLSQESRADYVRTARAKGLSRPRIVLGEMLPNAVLPVLTMAGLNLGGLLAGTVIVEQVFAWPGLGQALLNAVSQRDFPIVQAGLLLVAVIFVTVNLLVDLLYAVLDPRVRLT